MNEDEINDTARAQEMLIEYYELKPQAFLGWNLEIDVDYRKLNTKIEFAEE